MIVIPLALLLAFPVAASTGLTRKDKSTLHDAVVVLDALTGAPGKGIPQELFAKADCILNLSLRRQGRLHRGWQEWPRRRFVPPARRQDGLRCRPKSVSISASGCASVAST